MGSVCPMQFATLMMFFFFLMSWRPPISTLFPYTTLFRSQVGYANHFYRSAHKFEQICRHRLRRQICSNLRSEERFSRNAETDLVCRLLLEKKIIDVGQWQHTRLV